MEQTSWVVALYGSDNKKKEETKLAYSIREFGRHVDLVDLETIWNDLLEKKEDRACKIVNGPIGITTLATTNRPNWIPGSWHNPEHYRCLNYYSHWGKYLVQQDYIFLPLAELRRKKDWIYENFAIDGHIFIRPDYGEKCFNGELVATEYFKNFEDFSNLDSLDPKTLCVVSKPKKIKKELRLIIADGKVITGSTYRKDKYAILEPLEEQSDKEEIIRFAEAVIIDNPSLLPPCYVLDLGLLEEGYKVMEVGSMMAAGYYASDLLKMVEAVSLSAERVFNS